MKAPRSMTLPFGAILFFYWTAYAALGAFTSYYLLDAGLNNTVIGFILAGVNLASTLIQPFLAAWADRPGSPEKRRILMVMALITLLLSAGIFFSRSISAVLCCAVFALSLVMLGVMQPFINALGMEAINRGLPIRYGISRAFGSIGYAAMAMLLGELSLLWGAKTVPISAMIMLLPMIFCCLHYPLSSKPAAPGESSAQKPCSVGEFIRRYPLFMVLMLGCMMSFLSHAVINSYLLQIVSNRGGDTGDMGLMTALAVAMEVIPMFLLPVLTKRYRYDAMLRISGIGFAVKSLLTLLSFNLLTVAAAQVFQLLGWGLNTLFLILYTNTIIREEDSVKGQAFATAANSLGSALGALIGGRLLDVAGVNAMLTFGTIMAGIGAVLTFVGTKRR